ncbi:MAG TPA: cytidylate kinase-like family protein [Anaerolinea sp.]|nr:cytidylate kinase-like family protein [Anaerolinea sp.]
MAGITISRQMGSLGRQVAEETARKLNFRMVWRDLINQAARRAGVPEVALATIDELGILGIKPSRADQQAYHKAVRQVMMELATEGDVVIVGRAGQVILQDVPGFLHVRVFAPKEVRVTRIMQENGITHDAALAMIEKSDQSRAQYLQQNYHVNLNDPGLYDLMINSHRYTVEAAADLICMGLGKLSE